MKALLLTTALAAIGGPAMAATFTFTNVSTAYPDNSGIVTVPGFGTPWTTPIIFTTSDGQTITTYCDDLGHDVTVEGGQNLTYETALVTTNGLGDPISEAISNEMGQLTTLGLELSGKGDEGGAIAAQGALWGIEYGVHVTSTDPSIQSTIDVLESVVSDDGRGWALGLIDPLQGDQGQILPEAIPEASTWLMLLTGSVAMGFMAFRRRAQVAL
jgi:hypothetical protein